MLSYRNHGEKNTEYFPPSSKPNLVRRVVRNRQRCIHNSTVEGRIADRVLSLAEPTRRLRLDPDLLLLLDGERLPGETQRNDRRPVHRCGQLRDQVGRGHSIIVFFCVSYRLKGSVNVRQRQLGLIGLTRPNTDFRCH